LVVFGALAEAFFPLVVDEGPWHRPDMERWFKTFRSLPGIAELYSARGNFVFFVCFVSDW
jgi:hypothetical protein